MVEYQRSRKEGGKVEILEKIDLFQREIDKLCPLEGDMLGQIQDFYRIGLTWTSNALEGNSLTESETKVLLEDGLTVGGKPLRDVFEAVDHAKAYGHMFSRNSSRRRKCCGCSRSHFQKRAGGNSDSQCFHEMII